MSLPGFGLICRLVSKAILGHDGKIRCKSRKSFVPHLTCAPNPATPYALSVGCNRIEPMDQELAEYIVNHFDILLTGREKLGLKQLRHQYVIESSSDKNDVYRKIELYKKIGWLTEDKEILELVKGGQDALNQMIAKRIMAEHADEVFINKCPNCGRLARTPLAKQCRHCGHSWR